MESPIAHYFAWVGPEETTFSASDHARFDETVFAWRLHHEEGDFAVLELEIRNPQIGPLAAEREQWCWFALEFASLGIVPRFFGRLRAVPENMHREEVVFVFRARPADYDERQEAVAATLRDLPEFDRVWLREERWDDPDAVLDARPAAWHIDPVTHDVTISDFNVGEDGTVELTGPDVFVDTIDMEPDQPPIGALDIVGEVGWRQGAHGSVDLTKTLIDAFKAAGSGGKHRITTYTGGGFERDWPDEGKRIGAGWSVGESSLRRSDGLATEVTMFVVQGVTGFRTGPQGFGIQFWSYPVYQFPLWSFWPVLNVDYEAERSFTETVRFQLTAEVQATDTEAAEQPPETLTFASPHVGEPTDPADSDNPEGVTPIGDLRRRSYFGTDRGKSSLQWLIHRGVAEIRMRARAVKIIAETSLLTAMDFSLRKSARITHDTLAIYGGEAAGKIIAVEEYGNTDTGVFGALVTIGCTVGKGGTVTATQGTPDYVEEGVLVPSLQTWTGQSIMPIAGEVTYDAFTVTPNDDGIDFFNMTPDQVLIPDSDGNLITVNGGQDGQEQILDTLAVSGRSGSMAEAADALDEVYTNFCINLKPLNTGPHDTDVPITPSPVEVIKTIDLEAAVSS